jgi:hypothetical protein
MQDFSHAYHVKRIITFGFSCCNKSLILLAAQLYCTGFWTTFGLKFLQLLHSSFKSWIVHVKNNLYVKLWITWTANESQERSKYIAAPYLHCFLSMIFPAFCSEDFHVTRILECVDWKRMDIQWLKCGHTPFSYYSSPVLQLLNICHIF